MRNFLSDLSLSLLTQEFLGDKSGLKITNRLISEIPRGTGLVIILFFMCFFCYPAKSQTQANPLIPVLIVDGFSNHDWKQTTALTKWILEQSGKFEVAVSTIPEDSAARQAWLPDFTQYAVVIQNTNNIHSPGLRWSRQAEEALEKYVKAGGGLYILHSANNAFPHWRQYDEMIGLGWRKSDAGVALEIDDDQKLIRHLSGEGSGTGHGDRFNALVEILNRHPINRGYPEAWQTVNTEVYYFPRGAANNLTVLSYAYDSASTHKNWPLEWVVDYGKGRVYNSSLGHLWEGETYPPAYRCIGYQTTVIRATEWLATGQVTYPVPGNFPTRKKPSLSPENGYLKAVDDELK